MTNSAVNAASRKLSAPAIPPLLVLATLVALVSSLAAPPARAADTSDRIFTIGNYPIQADASNAVAAKERAIADGQQAAFRSLLKRLVPVTAYRQLDRLKSVKPSEYIDSFEVRSERNSSTTYIASYDFAFSPDPVRRLLDREGIPYLDRPAPAITIVPAYRITPEVAKTLPPTFSARAGADAWLYAWKALDLGNSLTPASLQPLKPEVHADTIRSLAEGDLGMLRTLSQEYRTETIVLAVLEPEPGGEKLKVVLVGRDAVQNLYLSRLYRLDDGDLAYTAEFAAGISMSILEGRWKAINVRNVPQQANAGWAPGAPAAPPGSWGAAPAPAGYPAGPAPQSGGDAPIALAINFQGMAEWQEISRRLAHTPSVSNIEVLGLTARRARVSLNYPRGAESLAAALAQYGLAMQPGPDGWLLTRR